MRPRDYDYVEARLLDPAGGGMEAYGRLAAVGEAEAAEQLMKATATYIRACRNLRFDLADKKLRDLPDPRSLR